MWGDRAGGAAKMLRIIRYNNNISISWLDASSLATTDDGMRGQLFFLHRYLMVEAGDVVQVFMG